MTDEGREVWEVILKGRGQLRIGGMGGPAGFDAPALFQICDALGGSREALAVFLPDIEAGALEGFAEWKGDNS